MLRSTRVKGTHLEASHWVQTAAPSLTTEMTPAKYFLKQRLPLLATCTHACCLFLWKLPTSYWKNQLENPRLSPAVGATLTFHRLERVEGGRIQSLRNIPDNSGSFEKGGKKPLCVFPFLSYHVPVRISPSCYKNDPASSPFSTPSRPQFLLVLSEANVFHFSCGLKP